MIKIVTDLQEPFEILQKLKGFDKEEVHLYFLYKLDIVDDVIDFFNKVIVLADKYKTTLLLHEYDLNKEPVRQIYIKYKDVIDIEEISNGFYKRLFERKRCSLSECITE